MTETLVSTQGYEGTFRVQVRCLPVDGDVCHPL